MLDLRLKKILKVFFLGNTVIGATFIAGLLICLLLRILLRINVLSISLQGVYQFGSRGKFEKYKGTDIIRIFFRNFQGSRFDNFCQKNPIYTIFKMRTFLNYN